MALLNKVEIVMLSSTEKQFWKVINDVAWRFLLWGSAVARKTGRITNEKPFKLAFHLFPLFDGQLVLAWLLFMGLSRGLTKADMMNIKAALVLSPELSAAGESCKESRWMRNDVATIAAVHRENFQINDLSWVYLSPLQRILHKIGFELVVRCWKLLRFPVKNLRSVSCTFAALKIGMMLLCWVFFFCRSSLFFRS